MRHGRRRLWGPPCSWRGAGKLPEAGAVAATVEVGKGPDGLIAAAGALWVALSESNRVARITPAAA